MTKIIDVHTHMLNDKWLDAILGMEAITPQEIGWPTGYTLRRCTIYDAYGRHVRLRQTH